MKKIILTAVLGCFATLFAVNANAQVHIVNGTESGNYTLSAAFQYIWSHSADELTVTLTENIDLNGVVLERPTDYAGFRGTFDGHNYTIQNFSINASLFGNLYGTVKNLNVKNVPLTISSAEPVGGICDICYGEIDNVHTEECSVTNTGGACSGIAGLVYGTIRNSVPKSAVHPTEEGKNMSCGVAYIPDPAKGKVINSYYTTGSSSGMLGKYLVTNVIRTENDGIFRLDNYGDGSDPYTIWDSKYMSPYDATSTIETKGYTAMVIDNKITMREGGDAIPANIQKVVITENGSIINQSGQVITNAVIQKLVKGGQWNFIGLPIAGGEQGIGISPLANVEGDIWALQYNYTSNTWNDQYLHWNETNKSYIGAGEGIFAWPDADYTLNIDGTLVNGNVSVTKNIPLASTTRTTGNWMALANPYPAAIKASSVANLAQGQVWYSYDGTAWQTSTNGTIPAGDGFFLNMSAAGNQTVPLTPSMIDGYTTTTAKSTPAERDFLTVSVSTNGYKVPVMFAKNEAATAEYDIFDANKMFGDGSVAEPYLICNDKNLCKEEVNALPYTATMNIKSGEARSIDIIAENVPEGYTLTLIDNEEEIVMNQGDTYTVEIASGENADRFKLKIGEKNVSITDVEVAEALSIRNNNRNIIIEGGKNIKAEVYNTLGQKVYETTKRNFALEGMEAGAYVVKVQSGNAVQSRKVIIK